MIQQISVQSIFEKSVIALKHYTCGKVPCVKVIATVFRFFVKDFSYEGR